MNSDSNLCPVCETRAPLTKSHCPGCHNPLRLDTTGGIAVWCLDEIPGRILQAMVRTVSRTLQLPVLVQPARLDPRPSRRPDWNGVSSTAFLNQVDRRSRRGTVFSLGVTAHNIVPGVRWNYLFGYAYLGMPSCVISLHKMSSDHPPDSLLVKRAATVVIHEIGHNCGLDHHGYNEDIACVMIADTELDCLERLDQGTHQFCRAWQATVNHRLRR